MTPNVKFLFLSLRFGFGRIAGTPAQRAWLESIPDSSWYNMQKGFDAQRHASLKRQASA